jgi:catechol 2,3-dioxygenase-like lactoylglutathione lyase family enzyme
MNMLCLLVLLIAPLGAPTESPAASAIGAFFALSVANLDASVRWYSEKLGMKVVMREPKRDGVAVAVLEGGGLVVELIALDDAAPLSKAAPGVKDALHVHGLVKAGAIVADFEGTLRLLRERNVEIAFGPFPARANQRANVIIRDNAGNLIQFFASSP